MDSLVWGIRNPCVLRKSEIYLNNLIYIKLNKTKYDIFTMKKKIYISMERTKEMEFVNGPS